MSHSGRVWESELDSTYDKDFNLGDENADPTNWDWPAESKTVWRPAKQPLLEFHQQWYGNESSLPVDSDYASYLPITRFPNCLPHENSISSSIFIPKSYSKMFDIVWSRATSNLVGTKGIVITGQPGVGKTLFTYYLLVRLLQRKQVVLYTPDGENAFLFYHDGAYVATVQELAHDIQTDPLPCPSDTSNAFIWSLFNISIREQKEPSRILVDSPCYPIQTTSADATRYYRWVRYQLPSPLITGLPLWTRDELAKGLKYQKMYKYLHHALSKPYWPAQDSGTKYDPIDGFLGAREILNTCYDIQANNAQPSPEEAISCLLDAAIQRFGYSARDVFSGVFGYQLATNAHLDAFNVTPEDLGHVIHALSCSHGPASVDFRRIFSVNPIIDDSSFNVTWKVDFKSEWVAQNVIWALRIAEDTEIVKQIRYLRDIPAARGLAGCFLESLVHRLIAEAQPQGSLWRLSSMVATPTEVSSDPPQFRLGRTHDCRRPRTVKFSQVKREVVKFNSISDLQRMGGLRDKTYYIPANLNFPFFDSFAIDLDAKRRSAILWILQVTTAQIHGGSSEGYQKIREIIEMLKDEFQAMPPPKKKRRKSVDTPSDPTVEVRYVLVLSDKSQSHDLCWRFPKGWSEQHQHDHRGNVYCLEIPLEQ